jgi:Sulfotransferase domain
MIVWLASYPKSGNTWLRAFLANYKIDDGKPVDVNELHVGFMASGRELFDLTTGIESSDLTADEIDRYRPAASRQAAAASAETLLVKIHDAYVRNNAGEPLVPADVSRGAIYILRNPLDVAVSFAYHSSLSFDRVIEHMADETYVFSDSKRRLGRQLRQKLLSWRGHVLSWNDQTDLPILLLRYEDMVACPLQVFGEAVRFSGWEYDAARVERALQLAAFENLQAQERARGFDEKPPGMAAFFRKGQVGSWREELNPEQVARIVQDHGAVMRRFGYLSETGVIC